MAMSSSSLQTRCCSSADGRSTTNSQGDDHASGTSSWYGNDASRWRSNKPVEKGNDCLYGHGVAEELVFGPDNITSGAMSDIQSATRVARNMVTKCGFSDAVGVVFHGGVTGEESASDHTRDLIDSEVKKLTDAAYKRAKDLLTKYSREHKLLAETLLEYETLTGDEVRDIVLKRQKPKRPVINKESGQRGDQSVIGGKQAAVPSKPKTRIPGMSMERAE
jgi:hypothetical protein